MQSAGRGRGWSQRRPSAAASNDWDGSMPSPEETFHRLRKSRRRVARLSRFRLHNHPALAAFSADCRVIRLPERCPPGTGLHLSAPARWSGRQAWKTDRRRRALLVLSFTLSRGGMPGCGSGGAVSISGAASMKRATLGGRRPTGFNAPRKASSVSGLEAVLQPPRLSRSRRVLASTPVLSAPRSCRSRPGC